jgi:hypothetical protein
VQTSCGFGVPIYEHSGERDRHFKRTEKPGDARLAICQARAQFDSIDGLPSALAARWLAK